LKLNEFQSGSISGSEKELALKLWPMGTLAGDISNLGRNGLVDGLDRSIFLSLK
jgi:hypothetical protein